LEGIVSLWFQRHWQNSIQTTGMTFYKGLYGIYRGECQSNLTGLLAVFFVKVDNKSVSESSAEFRFESPAYEKA
jgi:hypothetical protein